jgi:hypothetical protein
MAEHIIKDMEERLLREEHLHAMLRQFRDRHEAAVRRAALQGTQLQASLQVIRLALDYLELEEMIYHQWLDDDYFAELLAEL